MEEKRYIISDASKLIEVESHVLRYWEEELGISIPRNEMGHRYYTDFYIDLFKKVKELKDSGFQLKAIKMLVPELMNMYDKGNESVDILKDELFSRIAYIPECNGESGSEDTGRIETNDDLSQNDLNRNETESVRTEDIDINSGTNNEIKEIKDKNLVNSYNNSGNNITNSTRKLEQFQTIISEVVSNALRENTGVLGKEVSEIVSDNVIKEMDYLMHIREKQEEERFKKLDEAIRSCQVARKENAKTGKGIIGKLKRLQS